MMIAGGTLAIDSSSYPILNAVLQIKVGDSMLLCPPLHLTLRPRPGFCDVVLTILTVPVGQELTASSSRLAEASLQMFKSCLRTTLLLLDGYECQEKDGGFMLAFADARTALEWAASLQLALIR